MKWHSSIDLHGFFLESREGIQRGCSCAQQILCIGGGKCLRVPKVKAPFAHWQGGVEHISDSTHGHIHGHCTRMKRTKRDCSH